MRAGLHGPLVHPALRRRHGDGSVYGLAAIGTHFFTSPAFATPESSADAITTELVTWITEHEQDLGLPPGLDDTHIELTPADGFVQRMGELTILRFVQHHHAWPLLPPDDLVQLVRVGFVDDCDLQFEVDGEPVTYEIFRPGRACWVNRCEPTWTVHIDYCDGEVPLSCP